MKGNKPPKKTVYTKQQSDLIEFTVQKELKPKFKQPFPSYIKHFKDEMNVDRYFFEPGWLRYVDADEPEIKIEENLALVIVKDTSLLKVISCTLIELPKSEQE